MSGLLDHSPLLGRVRLFKTYETAGPFVGHHEHVCG